MARTKWSKYCCGQKRGTSTPTSNTPISLQQDPGLGDKVEMKWNGGWFSTELIAHASGQAVQLCFDAHHRLLGLEESIWDAELIRSWPCLKEHLRFESKAMQDNECSQIATGMKVCAICKKDDGEQIYRDAIIISFKKTTHKHLRTTGEYCQCTFRVLWLEGSMHRRMSSLKCADIALLSNKDIDKHPLIVDMLKGNVACTSHDPSLRTRWITPEEKALDSGSALKVGDEEINNLLCSYERQMEKYRHVKKKNVKQMLPHKVWMMIEAELNLEFRHRKFWKNLLQKRLKRGDLNLDVYTPSRGARPKGAEGADSIGDAHRQKQHSTTPVGSLNEQSGSSGAANPFHVRCKGRSQRRAFIVRSDSLPSEVSLPEECPSVGTLRLTSQNIQPMATPTKLGGQSTAEHIAKEGVESILNHMAERLLGDYQTTGNCLVIAKMLTASFESGLLSREEYDSKSAALVIVCK